MIYISGSTSDACAPEDFELIEQVPSALQCHTLGLRPLCCMLTEWTFTRISRPGHESLSKSSISGTPISLA